MAPRIVFELLRGLEQTMSVLQGKGYGSTSVKAEIRSIQKLLGKAGIKTCVDIGGNIGNYTAELNTCFPKADIFTFEPSQTNIAKLQSRFAGRENIRIVPFAVSDFQGDAVLHSDVPGSGLSSLTKRDLDHIGLDFEATEDIKTIVFQDFWKSEMGGRDIDILKLDIEGHELAALRGCGDALKATKIVQFEFGGCNIDTKTFFRDFWHFFTDNGFTLYRIAPWGEMRIPKYREREEVFSTTNFLALRN